jgi:hypothetical protein
VNDKPHLRYRWYVVLVLTVIDMLSFVDRQILGLLVAPIKHVALRWAYFALLSGSSIAPPVRNVPRTAF